MRVEIQTTHDIMKNTDITGEGGIVGEKEEVGREHPTRTEST